ncbi:MAG: type II toxin-antitoxin system RelB/DinJ family antitoxin [Oscillospiraceae bacterium]|nr:type II toxin-antitoxin system RelB/DinJ family antitoxin [Oscillospiraceae bacterium]
MATTSITVRIDEDLKKQVELLFNDMGLNMTTAFIIFAKAVVKQNKIPFEITADPFFCESNMANIKKIVDKYESGDAVLVTKTMEELEDMANA